MQLAKRDGGAGCDDEGADIELGVDPEVGEIARARALYDAAAPGLSLLEPDAQRCARACADGYAEILSAIESIDYDSFTTRARVGTWARGRLMWSIWRNGTALPNGTIPLEPIIRWQGQTISRAEEMAS